MSPSAEVVFDELFLRQLEALADLLGRRERLRFALKQLAPFADHPNYAAWQMAAGRALATFDRRMDEVLIRIALGVP